MAGERDWQGTVMLLHAFDTMKTYERCYPLLEAFSDQISHEPMLLMVVD